MNRGQYCDVNEIRRTDLTPILYRPAIRERVVQSQQLLGQHQQHGGHASWAAAWAAAAAGKAAGTTEVLLLQQ